ncbi:flagellar basal body rod protein FlgB [Roseburia sp. MUC/MUC-530-WT-4D]|uniref:Flagellar basal body rod protein FlgB n=1 Tax=Roseburia porci TaxID=2605790 RepID=A0A6L5YRM1_9FIRM|nr:flagellar basal body rod protein FlgB [Roseburia porci]MCI5516039.1 flagellar basal body rod protein FlgB [Roseburia sp.]MST74566.1 flagellar basal body rod protein FlgB [Roseburia porci]
MLTSNAFNYVNVLDKAADASWTRKSVIDNNIANVDTPGYKRQEVDFESVLKRELGDYKYESLNSKINHVNLSNLHADTYTDYANYSYRMDGNNVDIDVEETELASEQIKYEALTSSISSEFARMKAVIS